MRRRGFISMARNEQFDSTCIVSTGGTFEKVYNTVTERMELAAGQTVVPEILSAANVEDVSVRTIIGKDSLDIGSSDRLELTRFLSRGEFKRYVVVHGTSRLVETARFLVEERIDVAVVCTGAMKPYRYSHIEASFNLGFALGVCRLMKRGVVIAMNGRVFDPYLCSKDEVLGRFVPS
jgi:L-asparaginase